MPDEKWVERHITRSSKRAGKRQAEVEEEWRRENGQTQQVYHEFYFKHYQSVFKQR